MVLRVTLSGEWRNVRKTSESVVSHTDRHTTRLGRGGGVRDYLPSELRVKVSQIKITTHIRVEGWLNTFVVQVVPSDASEEGVGHDVFGIPNARAQSLCLVLLQQSLQKVASTGCDMRPQSQGLV